MDKSIAAGLLVGNGGMIPIVAPLEPIEDLQSLQNLTSLKMSVKFRSRTSNSASKPYVSLSLLRSSDWFLVGNGEMDPCSRSYKMTHETEQL